MELILMNDLCSCCWAPASRETVKLPAGEREAVDLVEAIGEEGNTESPRAARLVRRRPHVRRKSAPWPRIPTMAGAVGGRAGRASRIRFSLLFQAGSIEHVRLSSRSRFRRQPFGV